MDRLLGEHRFGWRMFLIVIVCAAGVAGMLAYRVIFVQSQIDRVGTALKALCAQRDDLDQRIVVTTSILQTHPGRLVFGIPRKLIASGLHRDLNTRQNLEILNCKETP